MKRGIRSVGLLGVVAFLVGCDMDPPLYRPGQFLFRDPKELVDLFNTLPLTQNDIERFLVESRYRTVEDMVFYTAPEWNRILERQAEQREEEGKPRRSPFKLYPSVPIRVIVEREPRLSQTYHVGPDGYIDFPYVGEVYVEGLTIREFKAELRAHLERILVDPVITVNITHPGTGPIAAGSRIAIGRALVISGGGSEGGHSGGILDLTGTESMADAVFPAGVGAESDWDRVVVMRKDEEGRIIVIMSNLRLFLQRGDLYQDFPLENEDVVYIPPELPTPGERALRDVGILLGWMGRAISFDGAVQYFEDRDRLKPF